MGAAAGMVETGHSAARRARRYQTGGWLFKTGAGPILIAVAILVMFLGLALVRAASRDVAHGPQPVLHLLSTGTTSYVIGMLLAMLAVYYSRGSLMLIVLTPNLAILMLALTVIIFAFARLRPGTSR